MSVTPSFDGAQNVNSVAVDFHTVFVSDPAPYSSVLNQYMPFQSQTPPINKISKSATELMRYTELSPEHESNFGSYQGPFANLIFSYGK